MIFFVSVALYHFFLLLNMYIHRKTHSLMFFTLAGYLIENSFQSHKNSKSIHFNLYFLSCTLMYTELESCFFPNSLVFDRKSTIKHQKENKNSNNLFTLAHVSQKRSFLFTDILCTSHRIIKY